MFNNIRKKVNEVLQEGVSMSESLTTTLNKSNHSLEKPKVDMGIPHHIKLDAGTSLLQENEEIWKHLHEANEINAEKADNVAKRIMKINEVFNSLYVELTTLNSTMKKTIALQETLENCINSLDMISNQCQSFEEKIVEFEDLCEELELQERQIEHKVQMSLYKQKKLNELEAVRQNLSSQHDKNVKIFEAQLKQLQLERQAVFQDFFQSDLELYKQQGSIPTVEHVKNSQQYYKMSLEDIDLDDGDETKTDLENFLKE